MARKLTRIVAALVFGVMWLIPGSSHRYARRIFIERAAAKAACKKHGLKFQ